MNIQLNIRVDAPKGGVRRLALFALLPTAVVGASALVASATLSPAPSSWVVAGQPIPASSLLGALTQLDNRLAALEGGPSSSFRIEAANQANKQLPAAGEVVPFDTIVFDTNGETTVTAGGSIAQGTFTPKQAGTYLLICSYWSPLAPANNRISVSIADNGTTELSANDTTSSGSTLTADLQNTTSQTFTIAQLAAGDHVTCSISATTTFSQSTSGADRRIFTGTRLH